MDATTSCHNVGNGEEAIRWSRQKIDGLPDFIFLDLNMPRMDGRACLAEPKNDEGLRDIPVVIYSTSSHPSDREETLRLGADYFLTEATSFRTLCDDILKAVKSVGQGKGSRVL